MKILPLAILLVLTFTGCEYRTYSDGFDDGFNWAIEKQKQIDSMKKDTSMAHVRFEKVIIEELNPIP